MPSNCQATREEPCYLLNLDHSILRSPNRVAMEELRRHDAQTTMDSPPLTAIQAIDMALAIIESIPLTASDGADHKQIKKDQDSKNKEPPQRQ